MQPWIAAIASTLGVSVLMFFSSLALAWAVIVRLPVDYLTRIGRPQPTLTHHPPIRRVVIVTLRNALGILLLGLGLVMLITPGQGILFILMGLSLVDLPGKQTLVRKLLKRPAILKGLNRIRRSAHRPPLEAPPHK